MRVRVLAEPELEFRARNRHIDPRFGVTLFGPADADMPTAPTRIVAGLIGAPDAVDGIRRWLDRCRVPIKGKSAKPGQENMFPDFPGFNTEAGFVAELLFDDSLVREIPDRGLRRLAKADAKASVADATDI